MYTLVLVQSLQNLLCLLLIAHPSHISIALQSLAIVLDSAGMEGLLGIHELPEIMCRMFLWTFFRAVGPQFSL